MEPETLVSEGVSAVVFMVEPLLIMNISRWIISNGTHTTVQKLYLMTV
jgi:hypothetical protein